jgi:Fe-S oxidoreductase
MAGITVQHHSEYLLELMAEQRIPMLKMPVRAVYHDPCELGRGSGIYHQPRLLLDEYVNLIPVKNEKESAFCCGGSLANVKIQMHERNQIRDKALDEYLTYEPEMLITACPLCKKTFAKSNKLPVHDIAEIVYLAISKSSSSSTEEYQHSVTDRSLNPQPFPAR